GAQLAGELFVLPADADELRVVEAAGDLEHHVRALPAEHDQAGIPLRIEPQLPPLRRAVDLERLVKSRIQDHARSLEDACVIVTQLARLFVGGLRATDEILTLPFAR